MERKVMEGERQKEECEGEKNQSVEAKEIWPTIFGSDRSIGGRVTLYIKELRMWKLDEDAE